MTDADVTGPFAEGEGTEEIATPAEQEQPSQAAFATALSDAISEMRDVGRADIVALYPYDEETDSFFAPVTVGIGDGDMSHALADLDDQLRRFRSDEAEGKLPEDLLPAHYGSSAWLLATRRPLITKDAQHEVDASFVRRHHISSIVGLPLLASGLVVALLYLNYVEGRSDDIDVTDAAFLERVQEAGSRVAVELDVARRNEESATLRAISDLVSDFTVLPSGVDDEDAAVRHLNAGIERILTSVQVDAAILYAASGGGRLTRVAAGGCPVLSKEVRSVPVTSPSALLENQAVVNALARDDLYPLTALAPRGQGQDAVLLLAGFDPMSLQRRIPVARTLLQTAADLLGSMLTNTRLVEALGDSNRTLGAVTRLSTRLLQPGATEDRVLEIASEALTDPTLPELDFEFAAIYLLDGTSDVGLSVRNSAGTTMSPTIDSKPAESSGMRSEGSHRIPAWITPGQRALDGRDVLSYVATRQRAVVVGPTDAEHTAFLTGYPEDPLERLQVQLLKPDGSGAGHARVVRLRQAADRAPLQAAGDEGVIYHPTDDFTLDADLFALHGHGSLVRVFMPFGSAEFGERASGVLEAGYHISRRHELERMQIEALRACAATLASAVETARLYEDVTERAKQLEIVTEVGRTIATSIDLEQTLSLIARNLVRSVDASVCLIALLDEDGSAWYGAASSDSEDIWRRRRVERPERSIVFEAADTERPIVAEEAEAHPLVSAYFARLLRIKSLVALPLMTADGAIGAVILGQRDRQRVFTTEEVERAAGLADQAAIAIRNARTHAREEEEQHIQKDVVLVGFGQWGQKGYHHLVLLKNFFNFRIHVVERDGPGRRETLASAEQEVLGNGDLFYWDSDDSPAREALALELEPSCYVITYIATPAETHLPMLKSYYDLSNVVLIEKPLGAPPDAYREFLDGTDGSVQIIAADHYWFKIEVRLLQLLLTEERNLRAFLDEIEDIEVEILEEQVPGGSGAQIGMIADLIPHAFAVLSLLAPLDRIKLDEHRPLQVGRYQPEQTEHETYARLIGYFDHRGRHVRVTIDVGKGVANAKWIKLSGERRMGGRRSFYKFDFTKGEAVDGTQSALRAATRPIRQPGVPDNAHLSMLRHVVEKKHPAVGILSIREALRANARIQELERMAAELIEAGRWTPYEHGHRPEFPSDGVVQIAEQREAEEAVSS